MKNVTLERYRNGVREVHAELMLSPDGLTMAQLGRNTKIPRSSLQVILEENPLFYVDRWVMSKSSALARVWVSNISTNFEDCPRPDHT